MMPEIKKPERPADDDCCGGGCCPCVWDYYHDQLSLWLEQEGKQPLETSSEQSSENDSVYR
ncbi:oxidoreductase-like domain-containing protein [Endozoicomonas arenosclerae]|uniref:oxidoreductase-like domain-containing protein n=1 Tax=Endozoicomonas arenosclerae TaxID=1633495 RepID=UPI00155F90E5|nr:oxidoreductase-like domain-containing protein [Endozoicomonas arenosclerae]